MIHHADQLTVLFDTIQCFTCNGGMAIVVGKNSGIGSFKGLQGKRVGVIISGGNIDLGKWSGYLSR